LDEDHQLEETRQQGTVAAIFSWSNFFVIQVVSESLQYQKEMENSEETELDEETVILLRTPEIQALFREYDEAGKKSLMKTGKQMR
jgi:hypothetical protein